jgi:nitroreductase
MENIIQALNWRFAARVFDSAKKVSDADLHTILEAGRLAPSSFGIEPWHFFVIENPDLRAKLREVGYGQPKITDASHLIVIARRTDARENIVRELLARTAQAQHVEASSLDGLKNMVDGAVAGRDDVALDTWIRSQSYIPLGIMIQTASMLGIDNGPMEGFDPAGVDAILGLAEKHLTATTMLALGYRGADEGASRPKVRRAFDDVVTFIQ